MVQEVLNWRETFYCTIVLLMSRGFPTVEPMRELLVMSLIRVQHPVTLWMKTVILIDRDFPMMSPVNSTRDLPMMSPVNSTRDLPITS